MWGAPEGQREDDIVEGVVEVSVPDDGDEEHAVGEEDGGGRGRVSAHPDPLEAPGPGHGVSSSSPCRRTDCGASFLLVMNMTLLSSVLTAAPPATAKDVIINF